MTAARPPRRVDDRIADLLTFPFSHAALSATATIKVPFKVPAGREAHVEAVHYYNATGLAGDDTDAYRGEVLNGSTVVATIFNTDTNDDPAGAALAAGFTDGALSATTADQWLDAGESLDVKFTLEGTENLPAGSGTLLVRLY